MTGADAICAWAGLAACLLALVLIAIFGEAREINASLNDQPINDGSDCFHGERFTIASERDHG